MNHLTNPLSSADINIFLTENQQILLYQKNTDIDCASIHNFLFF